MTKSSSSNVIIPNVTLNSSHKMPAVAVGTLQYPVIPTTEVYKKAILDAIEVGYGAIDTAELYQAEEGIGAAIAEALERGLIKDRDELYITTRIWCNNAHPDRVLPALRESLRKLRLEYVDMFMIHVPVTSEADVLFDFGDSPISQLDPKSVWPAMEETQKLGLAKSLGICNFSTKKLEELLAHAEIIPAAHQFELHPAWYNKKLINFCKEKGIQVVGFSPLGGKDRGSDVIMSNALLKEIAQKKGKSVAQISLRWVYEHAGCMVIKSFNRDRLKENLDIFDWELTEEELKRIASIPQKREHDVSDCFVYPTSPFKTLEEFWDGEV
ncbi:hypothetical protein Sjap_024470 [Stephania japonica]|uniref:codeinone reductase (NADPH) n=2 Tax=Stephania japonica TaxID=461633 RepID=A0AAP0EIT4_9MAGN